MLRWAASSMRTTRKPAMVDHTFIYSPSIRKIKDLVDQGALVDIYHIDSVRISLGRQTKRVGDPGVSRSALLGWAVLVSYRTGDVWSPHIEQSEPLQISPRGRRAFGKGAFRSCVTG
jgi:hypothetical protein